MQMNSDLPTVENITSNHFCAKTSKNVEDSFKIDLVNLHKILLEFFMFYAERYEMSNHVISASIGRWQKRQSQDRNLNPAQERYKLIFLSKH